MSGWYKRLEKREMIGGTELLVANSRGKCDLIEQVRAVLLVGMKRINVFMLIQ